jgi:glycosyltransferase involved in cell wall biosynthesis
MRILRTYLTIPPIIGGMEKHIINLSRMQLDDNHFVKVFFNEGEQISDNYERICRLKIYKIRPQCIGIILFNFFIIIKIFLKKQSFDIIHIHGDWSSLIFAKILKKLVNAKILVFSIHDQLTGSIIHQKLLSKLVQNVDLIFSTGYDAAKELERLINKKVIVQPSGINEIYFEKFDKFFQNKKFTVISVANLLPKKNIGFILEIAKKMSDIDFVIAGDGPEKLNLLARIKKESISNVRLLGFMPPFELRKVYQQSDCYLLTSYSEGTPTSALEALVHGLPIVSSNAGGLGSIIKDGINGFIINDFKIELFIQKIVILKEQELLRKKMYANNKELAKNYSWNNVAKNITNHMERVLSE